MYRHTFAAKIRSGKKEAFRKALGEIWDGVVVILDEIHSENFSLWEADNLVFGYYETKEELLLPEEIREKVRNHLSVFDELLDWLSGPGQKMRLMYENIGIVRENKELIRHRVFMTKLKPGCAEEYKRRHDVLAAGRKGEPDPGPDSNFTIWSDGTYIFGYDEIDTTMEKDLTEEDLAETTAWETRQLEIMDWVTNDVDWLTQSVHTQVRRLAFHH